MEQTVENPNKDKDILEFFILPLVGIGYEKLGITFTRAFVNRTGTQVFLQFETEELHQYSDKFFSSIAAKGMYYQIYEVDDVWLPDMQLLLAGKYSGISKKAKEQIILISGLVYMRKLTDNRLLTAVPLLALTKDNELREYWEGRVGGEYVSWGRFKGSSIIPENSELYDIPTEGIYIDKII